MNGETWIFHKLANRKLHIPHEIVEPHNPVSQIEALLRRTHVAELEPCLPARLIFAQAFTLQLIGFEFEMRLDLLSKIICAPFAFEHGYASSPLDPPLPLRISPIAFVSRCHSLVFSTSCSRPFGVRE